MTFMSCYKNKIFITRKRSKYSTQHGMSIKDRIDTSYSMMTRAHWTKKDKIKYLGVTFDYWLTCHDHIQENVNRAYSTLGLIKRNFINMDSITFILLYTSLVRSTLIMQALSGVLTR